MRPVSLYSKDIENLNAYCVLTSGWYSILLFESKWYDFRAFPNWVSGILMFLYIAQRYGQKALCLNTLWAHGHVFFVESRVTCCPYRVNLQWHAWNSWHFSTRSKRLFYSTSKDRCQLFKMRSKSQTMSKDMYLLGLTSTCQQLY